MPWPIDPIDGAASEIGEIEPALTVNRDIVWTDKRLALIVVGEHFDFAAPEIGARDLRLELFQHAGSPRFRALARHQAVLRIDEQAVGAVAVLAKRRQHPIRGELHDALRHHLGEVHIAIPIDGGALREGQGSGDLWLLRRCEPRNPDANENRDCDKSVQAAMRQGSLHHFTTRMRCASLSPT